jgi:hypothetical protein
VHKDLKQDLKHIHETKDLKQRTAIFLEEAIAEFAWDAEIAGPTLDM